MNVRRRRNFKQRGAAFIFSLVALTGLVAAVAVYAAGQREALRIYKSDNDRLSAKLIADSAEQHALATLLLAIQNSETPNATTQLNDWYTYGEQGSQAFLLGDGRFRVQIVDAGSLINLNDAPEDQLRRLPLTDEQIDSLLDWREQGFNPRPAGAKDEYYGNLEIPYNAGLRRLETIDELTLIRGFVPQAIFAVPDTVNPTQVLVPGNAEDQPTLAQLSTVDSTAPNTRASGQTRINVANASVQQLQQLGLPQALAQAIFQRRATYRRVGDILNTPGVNNQNARTIIDSLSATGASELTGKINVNTASEPVLNSIPGITPDVATAIVSRQQSGILGLGDLLDVPGMSVPVLTQCVDQFCANSNTYLIRIGTTYGDESIFQELVVAVRGGQPTVVKRNSPSLPNLPVAWGWGEQTDVDIDLRGSN